MLFLFEYFLFGAFSKANNQFNNEYLPKNDLQVDLFEKSSQRNTNQQQVILKETIFNNEDCDNLNDTYINVDVEISGCQSINKGISFISDQQEGNTVQISNSIFIFNSSQSNDSMLIFKGTFLEINNVTIKLSTDDQFFSSTIFDCSDLYKSASPTINSLTFVDCILDPNISIFKLSNYPDINFYNVFFEGKSVQCKSFIECDLNSSVQFNNCNFSNFNEYSTIFALNYIKSELHFSSCNFFNNKCGLFYLLDNKQNSLTFENCHFFDNNATDILSFICLIGNQILGTIEHSIFTDCTFTNNYIYTNAHNENSYGTVIGLSNSLHFEGTNMFLNCHTTAVDQSDPSVTKNYGGALTVIHTSELPYELENCSFDNCSATNMGGGLFSCILSEQMTDDYTIVLHLTNCNFTCCFSLENGGGLSCGHSFFDIYLSGQTELKVFSSLFKECNSPIGGGIFFKDQSENGFEQSVLQQTTFDNCNGKQGTSFYIRSDYFVLINSTIENHYTEAVYEDDEFNTTLLYLDTAHIKTNIQIDGTVFRNNSGQSIEIISPSTMPMATINIFQNCQFIDNNHFAENHTLINCERVQAGSNGFANCSFINNRGRCIYCEMINCIILSIAYTQFIGNYGSNGACVCIYSDSSDENELTLENNLWINNTVYSDTTSRIHGGVLSIRNTFIETAGKNEFKDNRILSQNNNDNDEFYASGAALFVELTQDESIEFNDFSFENCFAPKSGGSVFVSSSVSVKNHEIKFTNCNFINNSNKENGGAICIETKGSTKVIITSSCFAKNFASNGGSIYIKEETKSESASVEISSSQFFNDGATESGGSIYISARNEATIQMNNFTQTKANIYGMVILIDLFSRFVMKDNNLFIDKETAGPSAIYVFSSSSSERGFEGSLEIVGGCFTSGRKSEDDSTADFLVYNVSAQTNLSISDEACFQRSKEESILVIGDGTFVVVDDSVFNCDKCDGFVPVESDSYSESEPTEATTDDQPTSSTATLEPISSTATLEPTSSTETLEPISSTATLEPTSSTVTLEPTSSATQTSDDGGSGHKGLGAGTIIGIVLCAFTAVSLIIIIIIYVIRRKRRLNKIDDDLLRSIDNKY